MKIIFMLIVLIVNTSCATRQPKKVDINLYQQGLDIMGVEVPKKKVSDEKICIGLSSDILDSQPIHTGNGITPYLYNIKNLINLSVEFKTCLNNSLKISNIYTKYFFGRKGYFSLPYAYYTSYTDLTGSLKCKNKSIQITSSHEKKIQRNENFKSKYHKNLVLAVTYLSFNSALSDIKQQYEKLLENDCNQ